MVILIMVLLVSALILGACSSGTSPSATSAPATSAPTSAPSSTQPQVSTATPASKTQPITIKTLNAFGKNTGTSDAITMLAEKLSAASNGELVINYVGGREVIAALDQPAAVRDGVVDLIQTPPGYYSNLVPQLSAAELCNITPPEQRANGIYDYWVKVHKQMNVQYLGAPQFGGGFYIFTNASIQDPRTDLKGLKIRSNYTDQAFIKALGATPVTVVPPELYSALQSHVVDGASWQTDNFVTFKAYEVTKYWINQPFESSWLSLLMNLDKFNSLSPSLQGVLLKVVQDLEVVRGPQVVAGQNQNLALLPTKGMKPITLSADDAKWFVNLAYSSEWDDKIGKMPQADLSYQRANLTK